VSDAPPQTDRDRPQSPPEAGQSASQQPAASPSPSLYRRHRPRSFSEVVGQESIVRTLRNAVQRGKVHHAYLFVGSRGTGKTSMAKILAACLNCERGPTTEPCGVCESCTAIANATSLDVIEMDAASNNSVDDIRDLRESVAFAPVSGRHKVYILDEAHMLSPQAWNAFLKTLEEPPPNTLFVLATTEAQKVLPTVVDRCHRFDFQRPTVEQIGAVVHRAAEAESIDIDARSIALIARSATGSFRDALGTLEQLLAYSGPRIALEDVVAVLGVADVELLIEALEAVAGKDARRALLVVARAAEGGRDPAGFMRDLEAHARALLVVQVLERVPPELSLTPEADQRLRSQAAAVPRGDVVRLLDLLAHALEALRAGADGRTQLELALVKAADPQVDAGTGALARRIERLEAAFAGGATPDASGPADPGRARAASAAGPPAGTAPPPQAVAATGAAPALAAAVAAAPPEPAVIPGPVPASQPVAPGPAAAPAPAPAPGPAAAPEPAPEPAAAAGPVPIPPLAELAALWPAVIDAVRQTKPLLAAVIVQGRPIALEGDLLTVAFAPQATFLCRQASDPANRGAVGEALRTVTGAGVRLSFELREEVAAPEAPALSEEEWVRRVLTEFDAEELPADAPTPPRS